MKRLQGLFVLSATLLCVAPRSSAQKTLFWMGDGRDSVQSFMAHKDKIDIIEPTWYQIDETGLVTGEPNPAVLKVIHDTQKAGQHLTLIPLAAIFDHVKIHALVNDTKAQDAMIGAFLREARENGYDGFNLDVEDVMWTDRDQLSAMVARVATALHAAHLQVQIDVCPNAPGHAGSTPFSKWIFEEWRLGYDLKALGQSVDLICLMTYDQNTHWTTPGPVGGWLWTKLNVDYALERVPKEKLSVGIALYGYHWFTGDPGLDKAEKKPNPTAEYISYANAMLLQSTWGGKLQWDDDDRTPWYYINRDQMREWVFFTDKRAFMERFDLAKMDGVEGVCSWVLGEEDPAIWAAIPEKR